jgi:hypothetical protein
MNRAVPDIDSARMMIHVRFDSAFINSDNSATHSLGQTNLRIIRPSFRDRPFGLFRRINLVAPSQFLRLDLTSISQAFARLQATGFELRWQSRADEGERQMKAAGKTKYICPNCERNAWAKPGAAVICGARYEEDSEICIMEKA